MRNVFLLFIASLFFQLSFAQWSSSGTNIYNSNSGFVGIGTSSPDYNLTVNGTFGLQYNGALKYHMGYLNGGFNIAESGVLDYRIFIKDGGNVGIGTSNPLTKLHVNGGQIIETSGSSSNTRTLTLMNAGSSQMNLAFYHGSWRSTLQIQNNDATKALFFAPPEVGYNYGILRSVGGGIKIDVGGVYTDFGTNALTIEPTGQVGIGTSTIPSAYVFAVNGDAIFTKIKVQTYTTWPGYVFKSNYKLPSLKDLENYIKQNNHLPEIPSAKEVEKNGLDLGDNQALLLKKIEELTLYIIRQDKTIKQQDKKIESQQDQITELMEIKKDLETIKAKLEVKTN